MERSNQWGLEGPNGLGQQAEVWVGSVGGETRRRTSFTGQRHPETYYIVPANTDSDPYSRRAASYALDKGPWSQEGGN